MSVVTPSDFAASRENCRVADSRINETSGLAASEKNLNVIYTHNDSGDQPRFYALNPSCEVIASYRLANEVAFDWEDMAIAPGIDGTSSLFFADMGDNFLLRDTIRVHEVPEPSISRDLELSSGHNSIDIESQGPSNFELANHVTYPLQYPDGSHDAETLIVTNDRHIVIVTKERDGIAGLYSTTEPLATNTTSRLTRQAVFGLPPISQTNPKPTARDLQITGGALSPDESLFVVRTTATAWLWNVEQGEESIVQRLANTVAKAPAELIFDPQSQSEAITFSADGRSLLTTSEGNNPRIFVREGSVLRERPAIILDPNGT